MDRIHNTLNLARASWDVLQADKELLWLPLMSFAASAAIAVTFLIPATTLGDSSGTMIVVGLVYYFVLTFVTVFFNAALVSAARERLRGGDPTVRSALSGATYRIGLILSWSVVAATVSVVLRAIEERAGFVGQLVAGLAGLAWSLVTFLVIPVIVVEGLSVGDAIRRSSQLFKQTWGENVAARVGFGLVGLVLVIPAVVVVIAAASLGSGALVAAIVLAVAWIAIVAVVMTALSAIFQTALYLYAADGSVSQAFPESAIVGAFSARSWR